MRTIVTTEQAFRPEGAPLSQALIANGFFYSSGFGPHDPLTGEIPDGIVDQTCGAIANVTAVLAEAGLNWTDVVKVTAHLANLDEDFAAYNEMYTKLVPAPHPARTTVGSKLAGFLVEIDVVAALRQ